ncbi:MAG: hypothetical protein U5K27_10125 [Desulfotignum sp.]|nr:hypothetical protein [Desulfotignum sp.]
MPVDPTRLIAAIISEQVLECRPGGSHPLVGHTGQRPGDETDQTGDGRRRAGLVRDPRWAKYLNQLFKGWDKGIANEISRQYRVDALDGSLSGPVLWRNTLSIFLEYCDWMGIPMQAISGHPLTAFKGLLTDQLKVLAGGYSGFTA